MAIENVSATAIVGLLVGFLVVGMIGVYVGNALIDATNLQGTATGTTSNATVGISNTTFATNVKSVDLVLYGGGGGGGAGNRTNGGMGGGAGAEGAQTTVSVAVTPGQWFNYSIGIYGIGVANASGTDGTRTEAVINGVIYTAAGGIGGGNHTSSTIDGLFGTTGYGSTHASLAGTSGSGAGAGLGGIGATGVGAGGGGGGGGGANNIAGIGGRGEHGAIDITTYTSDSAANPLATSQTSVIETFQLGVLLCKIIIIVSVASIVFMLLQRTGLIPRFGGGEGEGGM